MKTFDLTVDAMLKRYENTKKISKSIVTRNDFVILLNAVDAVNSLKSDDTRLAGLLLNEVKLPSFLQDFVFPQKVALGETTFFTDLVVRPDWPIVNSKAFVFNQGDILDITDKLASSFKKDGRELKTAEELRGKVVSLNNDANIRIHDNVRLKNDVPQGLPIPIDPGLRIMFKDIFWNMEYRDYLDLYFKYSFNFFTAN